MRLQAAIVMVAVVPVLAAAAVLLVRGTAPAWPVVDAVALGLIIGLALAGRLMRRDLRAVARLRGVARRLQAAEGIGARSHAEATENLGQLAATFAALGSDVRRALHEARQQHQQTEAILARMADGILVVDRDLRIRRLNPAAAGLLSLAPDRAVGRTIIEATMHHALDGLFRDAVSSGETRVLRLETIQPRRRVLQAIVTPLEGDGAGAVAVLQDLTELDRLEHVRRDFVTNVSHELRTPVTSIKVMAESLQRGAMRQPELADSFLHAITEAADRLARLVDDVLALARVEAGPGRIEWRELALHQLVAEAAGGQQPLAREYGVSIQVDRLDPIVVLGDPEGLRQAVSNLLSNGIKYNTRGGQVRLSLCRAPEGVRLVVADTGIGMAAEHLPRVFERFYRVDRGRSREVGGTGLGLAIVKHAVEAHGGQITVESATGKGSTFTLTLPERVVRGEPAGGEW